MNYALRKVFIIVIILGTIAVALNLLFGENTVVYAQRELIEGTSITWVKYDVFKYIKGLETSITDTTELKLELPRWSWVAIDGTDWYDDLGHDLAVLLNYVILIINVLLYPIKIGGYLLRFILALVGANYSDPSSSIHWMGVMCDTIIGLTIPYIGGSV